MPNWRDVDPELVALAPEFFVADVAAAVEFWVRAFGFERVREGEDFAVLRLGEARVMFQQASVGPRAGNAGGPWVSIRLMVDDVDAVLSRAVAAGAKVTVPLKSRDYGLRDFTCLDNNGFAVRFATPSA